MTHQFNRKNHKIDATGKAVGRIATEAAMYLRGKNKPSFQPHLDEGEFVTIENAAKLSFTGKKLAQKDYYHHTQYPGGLRRTPMQKLFEADPAKVVHKAVYGMLPKNKLRDRMIKRLTIKA